MNPSSVHILGIAPYERMVTAMKQTAEVFPSIQLDVFIGDLDNGVSIVQNAPPNTYDCIISRGGTAELIRRVTDIPVVEIQLSVYDILRTIKLAENYSDLYAIVGFPSITEPAHTLCDLLRYDVDIIAVHSAEEATETLQRLIQEGYHMVVCDMVTHTIAQQFGLDAFLITPGTESLYDAFEHALDMSAGFRRLRQENLFLRSITQQDSGRTIVLDADRELFHCAPSEPPAEFLAVLREKVPEIPSSSSLRFYYNERGLLYTVTAQRLALGYDQFYLFHCLSNQIPLRSNKSGLRSFNKAECEHLFFSNFYSLSNAMGELDSSVTSIAATQQPVMILGEDGTGKEQIARAIYLRSPLCNKPFVMVDCALVDDKSWDFLLGHYNSPLNDTGNTIYFQHLEALNAVRSRELLSSMVVTGIARRNRMIFSCIYKESLTPSETSRDFVSGLSCLTLRLPPLRSREDEIPSLASLYLNNLNLELGKQISGFDPGAIEQLRHYDWPNNYKQFQYVLHELATLATSTYIRSSAVAELLSRERALNRPVLPSEVTPETRTLEEITTDIIRQTVANHGGNRTSAAKQLGISRTTLWRYLNNNGS